MKAGYGHRLICENTMLVRHACKDKILRGVIEQSVSIYEGSFNWHRGDLVNSFCAGLEKAYSYNMVECTEALTHVSGAGATGVS